MSVSEPHLFCGPVRRELLAPDGVGPAGPEGGEPTDGTDGDGSADDARDDRRIAAALAVADAGDVLDAIDDGLDGDLEERGRSLSGGQRQRLSLARALLRNAEVLVLVEPTSAVDTHTEARIAARLAEHRRGRTTVLVTASPLLLDHADEVVLVEDGRVAASGRHHDLLRGNAAYRRVVLRGEED